MLLLPPWGVPSVIPIKASAADRERYVNNILAVWRSATDTQMADGRSWYRNAHRMARDLADGDVVKGAGLLAALSPQTDWWTNVELACDAFEDGFASRHFRDACTKARKILRGADPATVLPMQRKTGHFYRCILDPSDADAICVDRHAHDLMVDRRFGNGNRGLDAHGRYALVAHCYREAAQRLGELPQTVQAVTWVVWKDRLV